jgi:hypothetical protein
MDSASNEPLVGSKRAREIVRVATLPPAPPPSEEEDEELVIVIKPKDMLLASIGGNGPIK